MGYYCFLSFIFFILVNDCDDIACMGVFWEDLVL